MVSLFMGTQGTPPKATPPKKQPALIAGLIKGNQWVFIVPDHKGPRLFLGGVNVALGGGTLGFPWFMVWEDLPVWRFVFQSEDSSSSLKIRLPVLWFVAFQSDDSLIWRVEVCIPLVGRTRASIHRLCGETFPSSKVIPEGCLLGMRLCQQSATWNGNIFKKIWESRALPKKIRRP